MTQESFQKKIAPPDAIRGALLLGIVVGQRPDIEVPECEECRAQVRHLSTTIFGPPPQRPTHRVGEAPAAKAPAAKVAPRGPAPAPAPAAPKPETPKAPPAGEAT